MLNQPDLFAAPASALEQDLVLLDLETTGTRPEHDRIIEIGLVHLRRLEVVAEWSSLVDPGCRLSPFIEDHTGITGALLSGAPSFAEVADTLRGHLARGVLVAHNARFDYGFLQAEYARLGSPYQAPHLCTLKLSRKLFPAERRHNLDALILRHDLRCTSRHRALGDARVLAGFLAALPRCCAAGELERVLNDLL